jgi:hypothetical protein
LCDCVSEACGIDAPTRIARAPLNRRMASTKGSHLQVDSCLRLPEKDRTGLAESVQMAPNPHTVLAPCASAAVAHSLNLGYLVS